jgi:putative nucleotidyltransferase with HDIG domain
VIAYTITQPLQKERIKLILSSIDKLSAVPEFLLDVINVLEKPNSSINEAANVINKDQSIVTRILSIANSPFYGLYRKVASIEQALLIIGMNEVKNIVTTLTILETFKNKSDKYLDQKEFWEHSYLVGNLSKKLFMDFGLGRGSEAFIAGFLHDLGISITHKYFHDTFIKIYNEVMTNSLNYFDVESLIMGMNHQEIGMHLIDKWNFPIELCQAVLFHHRPSKIKGENKLAAIVHLGDYLVSSVNDNKYFWDMNYSLDLEGLSCLGIENIKNVYDIKEKYSKMLTNIEINV